MIWLVGNKGMLGTELSGVFQQRGQAFTGSDREVDMLDPGVLAAFAQGKGIHWIVNCAAYTAVDKAEDEEPLALRLNAEGPENLARLATTLGARLLHISTDYVFSGDSNRPYREDDPMAPAGAYGRTKAEGERRVMAASASSIIVRTAWLYGKHGPNFVYTMLRLMKERESIGVVSDQSGTPTWAFDLASAVADMIAKPDPKPGIYHYTNDGQTTWYEFAREIHRLGREMGLLERDCAINPLTTAQYPTKASRPAYSVLSKDKIKSTGIKVPEWKASLKCFFDDAFRFFDDMSDLSSMAAYDLETARSMLYAARYLYVSYSCQQAVEKNLKALWLLTHQQRRIHNLLELADGLGLPFTADDRGVFKTLTDYYLKGRYPQDLKTLMAFMDNIRAENLLGQTERLCGMIRKHPVFSIL